MYSITFTRNGREWTIRGTYSECVQWLERYMGTDWRGVHFRHLSPAGEWQELAWYREEADR